MLARSTATQAPAVWTVRCGYVWTRMESLVWTRMWCNLTSQCHIHFSNPPQDVPSLLLIPGSMVMDACLLPGHHANTGSCTSMPTHAQPFRVRLAAPGAPPQPPQHCNMHNMTASGTCQELLLCAADGKAAEQWVQAINDIACSYQQGRISSGTASASNPAGCLPQQAAGLMERYHIEYSNVLGSGLFATVYLATELPSGEKRAVKVLNPNVVKEHAALVTRELSTWSAVGSHPHICRLFDSWCSSTRVYMVSDLCSGGSLVRHLASRRTYSERDASRIMRQVLEALHHIHAAGVVHCDVKPENICMASRAPDSPIKLIDFSLSCFAYTPMTPGGTPEFVAPELLQSPEHYAAHGCGPAVDLWSAGVLLFFLLCGQTPFYAPSHEGILARVRSGGWDLSAPAWHNITNTAKNLIQQLLQASPDARPSAFEALRHSWFQVASTHPACTQPLQSAHMAFKVGAGPAALDRAAEGLGLLALGPPPFAASPSYSSGAPELMEVPSSATLAGPALEPAECLLAAVLDSLREGGDGAQASGSGSPADGAPYRRRRSQTFSSPGPVPPSTRLARFGSLPRDAGMAAMHEAQAQAPKPAEDHLEQIRALQQQVAELRVLLSSRATVDSESRPSRGSDAPFDGDQLDAGHLWQLASHEDAWSSQGQQQLQQHAGGSEQRHQQHGTGESLAVGRVSAAQSSPLLSSVLGSVAEFMSGSLSKQVTRLTEPGDECSPRRCLSMPSVSGGPMRHKTLSARLEYLQLQLLQVLSRQATLQSEGELGAGDACSLSEADRGSSSACSLIDEPLQGLLALMSMSAGPSAAAQGAGGQAQLGQQQQVQPLVACQAAAVQPEPAMRPSRSSQHLSTMVPEGAGPGTGATQTSVGASSGGGLRQALEEQAARLRQLQVLEQQLKIIAQRKYPSLQVRSP